jgi:DNA-binding CsgD family transcriptional regulator
MSTFVETEKSLDISTDAQIALSQEVEETIKPLLQKLKEVSNDPLQVIYLINILETSLHHLVQVYGNATNLAAAYQRLAPVETLVSSMIRQGLSTQAIATALHISAGTVSVHRKHIRKKLGVQGKAINLQTYLRMLAE